MRQKRRELSLTQCCISKKPTAYGLAFRHNSYAYPHTLLVPWIPGCGHFAGGVLKRSERPCLLLSKAGAGGSKLLKSGLPGREGQIC